MAIYGTLLTDEDEPNTEDEDESIRKAKARLKKYKVLEMPDTAKAEYLTRTFDENGVEILKKAIEQDIHKFSHIPCDGYVGHQCQQFPDWFKRSSHSR